MLSHSRILSFKRLLSRPTFLQSRSYASSGPRSVRSGPSGSTKTQNQADGDYNPFRPPWVYAASHILIYSLIPSVILYCVFIVDWVQEDHVFMPPRRWLARQKAAFFSLSSAEQELAKSDEDHEKRP